MLSIGSVIIGLALIVQTSAHVSLISIYGSNNVIGHGFGVNLYGKYPRVKGIPGDAGGDSGIFQTGTDNPSPACGRTPELGPLDIPAWLDQAEGLGLPAAHPNMSIVFEAFQVNRDGGGPMSCEYSEDATAASWKSMSMSLNQAGNLGIQNQVRTNETVVANFPEDAKCTGGWTQTACIVRCRTGVNKRFGGCFAAKLSGTTSPMSHQSANDTTSGATVERIANVASTPTLTDEQINLVAQQVIIQMKTQGLIISASASGTNSSSSLSLAGLACTSQVVQLGANANSTSKNSTFDASDAEDNQFNNSSSPSPVQTPSASNSSKNSALDASDAEDNHFNNSSPPSSAQAASASNSSALEASDIADAQLYNSTTPGSAKATSASINPTFDASDAADNQLSNSSTIGLVHTAPAAASVAKDEKSDNYNSTSTRVPEVPKAINKIPLESVSISTPPGIKHKSSSAKRRSRKCQANTRKLH